MNDLLLPPSLASPHTKTAVALRHNNIIRVLELPDNGLMAQGVQAILDTLADNTTVTRLNFARNRVSPEPGCALFSQSIPPRAMTDSASAWLREVKAEIETAELSTQLQLSLPLQGCNSPGEAVG